jgi:hypothetical protein
MAQKTLPNKSIEWIKELSIEEAKAYKNKFLSYELKGDGILKLFFFLNPYQSYTRHEAVATRKFNTLNKEINFARTKATLVDIQRDNHLNTYIYEVA